MQELLPEEQPVLQELYHHTSDATIKTRCQIILLSTKPMSVPQIAQVTFYSEDTVARCIREFHQSCLESLLPSPKGGRPPKITPEYLKLLLSLIEQDPRTGACFLELDCPLLAEYLARDTGICLDESRIRYYLHAHGYELLRPVLTVASPDPDYDRKRARIEELQRQAERGEIDLYYEAGIDLALLPTITHCWCKRGHQRKIEMPRQNQKRYGAGLIPWVSGKLYWATSDHKDNALFRSLLSQVLEPSDSVVRHKTFVVVDTYRIHFAQSGRAVLEILAAQSNAQCFFQTIDRLLEAITTFFQELAACPDIVCSVAGLAA